MLVHIALYTCNCHDMIVCCVYSVLKCIRWMMKLFFLQVKLRAERRVQNKNNLSLMSSISTLAGVGRYSHRER